MKGYLQPKIKEFKNLKMWSNLYGEDSIPPIINNHYVPYNKFHENQNWRICRIKPIYRLIQIKNKRKERKFFIGK